MSSIKQLELTPELFENPDLIIGADRNESIAADAAQTRPEKQARTKARGNSPQASKPPKTPKPPSQPYLPGLSRRGRPRSANPKEPSQRAKESRQRRAAAGMKRLELLLEPDVASKLDTLMDYYKVSRLEVISRLLIKAASRISKQKQAIKE